MKYVKIIKRLPWWLSGKESTANAADVGLIPGSARSPGERNANQLQYFAWEILRTREPGGPQSMGSQRVGHSIETKQQQNSLNHEMHRI